MIILKEFLSCPCTYTAIQDFDFYDFTKVAIVTLMSTAGVLEPVFLILS